MFKKAHGRCTNHITLLRDLNNSSGSKNYLGGLADAGLGADTSGRHDWCFTVGDRTALPRVCRAPGKNRT
eukprot:gene26170-biopygen14591